MAIKEALEKIKEIDKTIQKGLEMKVVNLQGYKTLRKRRKEQVLIIERKR